MVVVEGIGFKAPSPIRVVLSPDIVKSCHHIVKYMIQGRGYVFNNFLIGYLGEVAHAKYFNEHGIKVPANGQRFKKGDNGIDFEYGDITIQIKTRRYSAYIEIRRAKMGGRIIRDSLNADIYSFAQLLTGLFEPEQVLNLLGWIKKEDLLAYGKFKKMNGYHSTYIDSKYLLPMNRLIQELNVEAYRASNKISW